MGIIYSGKFNLVIAFLNEFGGDKIVGASREFQILVILCEKNVRAFSDRNFLGTMEKFWERVL